jgi:hypothetical protein
LYSEDVSKSLFGRFPDMAFWGRARHLDVMPFFSKTENISKQMNP